MKEATGTVMPIINSVDIKSYPQSILNNPNGWEYDGDMNIKNFKNLIEFTDYLKDEKTCQKYFEQIRFRDGDYCPHCQNTTIYRFSKGNRYRCAACKQDFTIKIGTIFGESKIPLRKWFIAIYLLSTSKKRKEPDKLPDSIPPNQTS